MAAVFHSPAEALGRGGRNGIDLTAENAESSKRELQGVFFSAFFAFSAVHEIFALNQFLTRGERN